MKYKKTKIKEDFTIWKKILNISLFAKKIGCDRSYLNMLKSGKSVASEDFYLKVKKTIKQEERKNKLKQLFGIKPKEVS